MQASRADPAVRGEYRFMFGIRGDGTDAPREPGTEIAVDRFQVLSTDEADPTITGLKPWPGSTTRDATPRIEATVRDDAIDLAAEDIRLSVKRNRSHRPIRRSRLRVSGIR